MWQYSLIKPLHWYWQQVHIASDVDVPDELAELFDNAAARSTMWIVLMLDFHFATGERIARRATDETTQTLSTQTRMFTAATNNMFKRLRSKPLQILQDSAGLNGLGLATGQATPGRAALIRPEAVNATLLDLAVRTMHGNLPKHWKYSVDLSTQVHPVWAGDFTAEPPRRRLRGKQPSPQKAGSQPTVPRERARVRPNHSVAITTLTLQEEQKTTLAAMPTVQRKREEKRLLHNQTASQFGYHHLDPFRDDEATQALCTTCQNQIELQIKPGSPSLDWSRARRQCTGEQLDGSTATNRRNVAKIRDDRNARIREHNLNKWAAEEMGHIFFELTANTTNVCKCRRSGCWLAAGRDWSYFKKYRRDTETCPGARIQGELTQTYFSANVDKVEDASSSRG